MTRKYRNHSADLKLKVALEAAKNELTTNQIASKYGVYPGQVMEWKKRLLEEGPSLFHSKKRDKPIEAYEDISYLQQQVGKLTTQIDWLKKKFGTTP